MNDKPHESQMALQARLYAAYQAARDAIPFTGELMPYRWSPLPDRLSGHWFAYGQMLEEFAGELANTINALSTHVHRLRAWAHVLGDLSDTERMEAAHEFVEVLGAGALGLPYVIKSRFAYAAAQLCHQANQVWPGPWTDDLPAGDSIYLNQVDPVGEPWTTYRSFKLKVEPIAGGAFRAATGDFRNAYNHRFPARLVLGVTNLVERRIPAKGQAPVYVIGGRAPLQPGDIADLLQTECAHAYAAFKAFQALVGEQVGKIVDAEATLTRSP